MRIKKDQLTKNEYVKAGEVWVRNFVKPISSTIDINNLFTNSDYRQVVINETANRNLSRTRITDESLAFSKVMIVSDGYDFLNKQSELLSLPKDVAIFAVNGALAKWNLISDPKQKRAINLYIVNNPYRECLQYLPKKTKYYPTCVASTRTFVEFVSGYPGNLFIYEPSPSREFSFDNKDLWYVDDYRNSVCAAINLAYRFGVQKLGLFCCDDSFTESRPGAVQLDNGLWQYPQHQTLHEIVDANLQWLTSNERYEIKAVNRSSGPKYKHAVYIDNEEALNQFFDEPL